MARYGFWNDYKYTPIHEKQDKAKRSQARLAKSHGTLQPVVASGRALATSWWGQAWNENLERYSDYSNRLPRGRSYLRGGMVLHLAITPGKVEALVQGSRPAPYAVTVNVAALKAAKWAKARAACAGQLESLQALLSGQFPDALKDLFMVQGGGLFPAPAEITFDCTCPDWASMCKHVAAVLYGVGTRLDADPKLFFSLRQVSVEDLVAKALQGTSAALIEKAGQAAGRALATADLGDVFGIDLDDAPAAALPSTPAKAAPKRGKAKAAKPAAPARATPNERQGTPPPRAAAAAASRKRPARLEAETPVQAAAAPRPGGLSTAEAKRLMQKTRMVASLKRAIQELQTEPANEARATPPPVRPARVGARRGAGGAAAPSGTKGSPILAKLLAALRGKHSGLAIPALMRATGFTETQARNAVARAVTLGLVRSPCRGVYALAGEGEFR